MIADNDEKKLMEIPRYEHLNASKAWRLLDNKSPFLNGSINNLYIGPL